MSLSYSSVRRRIYHNLFDLNSRSGRRFEGLCALFALISVVISANARRAGKASMSTAPGIAIIAEVNCPNSAGRYPARRAIRAREYGTACDLFRGTAVRGQRYR